MAFMLCISLRAAPAPTMLLHTYSLYTFIEILPWQREILSFLFQDISDLPETVWGSCEYT